MIRCCAKAPRGARLERAENLFAELCSLGPSGEWRNGQQRSIKNSTTDVEEEHSASKNMNSFTETLLAKCEHLCGHDPGMCATRWWK